MKWRRLAEVYRSTGSRFYSLFLSGEFILVAVFVEALVVAGLLLGVPLYLARRRGPPPALRPHLFFFGIGAGFMFADSFSSRPAPSSGTTRWWASPWC